MNLRSLTVVALVLAVGAIAAWVWLAGDGPRATGPVAPEVSLHPPPVVEKSLITDASAPLAPPARAAAPPEPQPPASPPVEPARMTSSVAPGMPLARTVPVPSRPVVAALPAGARASASRPEPQAEVMADLEGVRFMLRDFRTRMGGNPVGSNAEIMRAVMGGNDVKARLGPPPGQSLSEKGELLDRWGTPYFFHQISKTSMEIRSAGPDGRLWTPDDVVTK